MPIVLTIAGSDPSGGAGISADILAFNSLGHTGMFVITAVTSQNTNRVYSLQKVDDSIFESQLNVLFSSYPISAAKTGLIASEKQINIIESFISKYRTPLVVDPVLSSTSGFDFSDKPAREAFKKKLFPSSLLITPNTSEASSFLSRDVSSIDDAIDASFKLAGFGVKNVLVKGVKQGEYVFDVLNVEGDIKLFKKKATPIDPHGSGCVFSALITGFVASGYSVLESVMRSEEYYSLLLRKPVKLGSLGYTLNPVLPLINYKEKLNTVLEVNAAVNILKRVSEQLRSIIDDGSYLTHIIKTPLSPSDVVTVNLKAPLQGETFMPLFGSSEASELTFRINSVNDTIRSVISIPFDENLISKAEKLKLTVIGNFKIKAGNIANELLKEHVKPDLVIYLNENLRKRVLILGENPFTALNKLLTIISSKNK